MKKHIIPLLNEAATISLGARLAVACQQICIIYLYGEIGTGKTTFCRSFLRALGYKGIVKSPTYTLMELYKLPCWTIYHFDFYRLINIEELKFIGVQDYFNNNALCLIEWPQSVEGGILPAADITLTFHYQKSDRRQAEVLSCSTTGSRILAQLSSQWI